MRRTTRSKSGTGRILSLTVALGLAALLLAAWAGPAAAHEGKQVGRYRFAVGFGDEPAYAGQKNSVQLLLTTADGKPVTDLGDTLKVMVMAGNQSQDLALEPFFEVGEFGTPGDYRAFFIPSRPGRFAFHFHGAIKGQQVEQDFTSGPGTFGNVADPAQAAFPRLRQPSTAQVAQRLDREAARLDNAARATDHRARQTAGRVAILSILGPFGLVLGLVGMVMTGIALRTARRALTASSRPPVPLQEEVLRSRVEV